MHPVLFETLNTTNNKKIALITLNVENSLNSLSLEMIDLMNDQLTKWQNSDDIVFVWLQGAGEKAFCAGGDIRKLYDSMVEQGPENKNLYAEQFFEREYRLDYLLHTYKKPIVCWGSGIVMGGGVGLMSACSHRIVTESSRVAMPEITIGLYPDVGGSWFLNRMPGSTGLFLGLTGAHINAADSILVGFADRFISNDQKSLLLSELKEQSWLGNKSNDELILNKLLKRFEKKSKNKLPVSQVQEHFDEINQLCDAESLSEVVSNIIENDSDDQWMKRATKTLRSGSMITAHLVDQQIKRGKYLSLKEIFQMELTVSVQCALHKDFPEGVRALLIDKDAAPQWQYARVRDVPESVVDEHFTSLWKQHPLHDL